MREDEQTQFKTTLAHIDGMSRETGADEDSLDVVSIIHTVNLIFGQVELHSITAVRDAVDVEAAGSSLVIVVRIIGLKPGL